MIKYFLNRIYFNLLLTYSMTKSQNHYLIIDTVMQVDNVPKNKNSGKRNGKTENKFSWKSTQRRYFSRKTYTPYT